MARAAVAQLAAARQLGHRKMPQALPQQQGHRHYEQTQQAAQPELVQPQNSAVQTAFSKRHSKRWLASTCRSAAQSLRGLPHAVNVISRALIDPGK